MVKISILLAALAGGVLWFSGLLPGSSGPAGAADDVHVTYYGNGKVKSSVAWVDGRRDGKAQEWYAGGQLSAEGEYSDGQRTGRWSFWRDDGSLDPVRSGEYAAGKRIAD